MHLPAEAIAELEHCHDLGIKVVGFPEGVLREIPEPIVQGSGSPFMWPGQTHWFDTYGLASVWDYDPVWQKAQDLGYAVTFHGGLAVRPGVHESIANFFF